MGPRPPLGVVARPRLPVLATLVAALARLAPVATTTVGAKVVLLATATPAPHAIATGVAPTGVVAVLVAALGTPGARRPVPAPALPTSGRREAGLAAHASRPVVGAAFDSDLPSFGTFSFSLWGESRTDSRSSTSTRRSSTGWTSDGLC